MMMMINIPIVSWLLLVVVTFPICVRAQSSIVPSATPSATPTGTPSVSALPSYTPTSSPSEGLPDIPQTAADALSFVTLVQALTTAGLVDDLSNPNGPFTVFAPLDSAFATLPGSLL
mmetsp:Transcript_14123/g.30777  ORF Transcript_14123/g.30777 Transcript_14123/m.30777 type:complete len:117 (-) Transcript_14123:1752-2102(-)